MPIVQSTTYAFNTTKEVGDLFDMPTAHMYSRFSNPTTDAVEKKIAELEGGVAAMCTSSGQAASLLSILNLCSAGESFLCSTVIYGGTVNLFAVTLKRFGIECIFFDPDSSDEEIEALIKPNTRCVFGETLANPKLAVMDIERIANLAHRNGMPLIIDNTFPTPILCKPISFGADVVIHSTTKYMDGHALQVGGVIVDGGNFNWENGKYPDFCTPDESYHGVVYTRDFGKAGYVTKIVAQLLRDYGSTPAPQNSFYLNVGLETLALRMERHCSNALKVAEYLEKNEQVSWVNYPALPSNKYYPLVQKYMPGGTCGVVSFGVKGGREKAEKFMNSLKLAAIVTHVADARTCVLHPASSTHRQLSDSELVECGVSPDLIRFSVGIENVDDIIEDIQQALDAIK